MDIFWLLISLVILFFSVVVHECAHGLAAYKLGDPTAYYAGRITLDPRPHIDPMMTLIVPVVLFLMAGFVFGAAKPVPINPSNFRNPEKGLMLSSLAGPVSNLLLALLGLVLFILLAASNLVTSGSLATFIMILFYRFIIINVLLALVNIIPIPPLDGSRILRYFLPWDMKASLDRIEPYGFIIILLLFWMGGGILLGTALGYVQKLLTTIAGG